MQPSPPLQHHMQPDYHPPHKCLQRMDQCSQHKESDGPSKTPVEISNKNDQHNRFGKRATGQKRLYVGKYPEPAIDSRKDKN